MSSALPTETASIPENSLEMSDEIWLKRLSFHSTAPEELVTAASEGDVARVAGFLHTAGVGGARISKQSRRKMLEQLQTLWPVQTDRSPLIDEASLAHCLFETDLESGELSGRVETIMASTSSGSPDAPTLIAAFWLLRLIPQKLEPQTLFSLWRWTHEAGRAYFMSHEPVAADEGFTAFDQIEVESLFGWTYHDLKTERKLARQGIRSLQQAIDAATDIDGTPHAKWLDEIPSRLSQLARLQLFAQSIETSVLSRKDEKRVHRLFGRVAGLMSPAGMALGSDSGSPDVSLVETIHLFRTIADVLDFPLAAGTRRLFKRWESEHSSSERNIKPLTSEQERDVRKQFHKESHQSDWAEWGILRSAWSSPVDLFAIRHDGPRPLIDAVAADHPLFSGVWDHSLTVSGRSVETTGDWSCCCWYHDHQAAFMELLLDVEDSIQVIRQALLLRKESVLYIGDSVRLPESGKIEFSRTLPMVGDWQLEEDSTTRELALTSDERWIRLFPWTSPQDRIHRGTESMELVNGQLKLTVQTTGRGLFAATLFDWSSKRREEPVDWQRATVAEDGAILPPDRAVAHRLRLGKKQWVVYHTLEKPPIPRTALGIHTASETVVAELNSDGEVRTLVEVEL